MSEPSSPAPDSGGGFVAPPFIKTSGTGILNGEVHLPMKTNPLTPHLPTPPLPIKEHGNYQALKSTPWQYSEEGSPDHPLMPYHFYGRTCMISGTKPALKDRVRCSCCHRVFGRKEYIETVLAGAAIEYCKPPLLHFEKVAGAHMADSFVVCGMCAAGTVGVDPAAESGIKDTWSWFGKAFDALAELEATTKLALTHTHGKGLAFSPYYFPAVNHESALQFLDAALKHMAKHVSNGRNPFRDLDKDAKEAAKKAAPDGKQAGALPSDKQLEAVEAKKQLLLTFFIEADGIWGHDLDETEPVHLPCSAMEVYNHILAAVAKPDDRAEPNFVAAKLRNATCQGKFHDCVSILNEAKMNFHNGKTKFTIADLCNEAGRENWNTAIHFAAMKGRPRILALLLVEGGSPDRLNRFNRTPRMVAMALREPAANMDVWTQYFPEVVKALPKGVKVLEFPVTCPMFKLHETHFRQCIQLLEAFSRREDYLLCGFKTPVEMATNVYLHELVKSTVPSDLKIGRYFNPHIDKDGKAVKPKKGVASMVKAGDMVITPETLEKGLFNGKEGEAVEIQDKQICFPVEGPKQLYTLKWVGARAATGTQPTIESCEGEGDVAGGKVTLSDGTCFNNPRAGPPYEWVPRYGDVSAAVPVTPAMSKASSVAALPGGAVTTLLSGPGAVTIQNAGGDSVDVVVTAGMSRDDFAKQVQAALWQAFEKYESSATPGAAATVTVSIDGTAKALDM